MTRAQAGIRVTLLGVVLLCLLPGLLAGLARIGWALPVPPRLVAAHGPLMASAFLGALVAAERAAALRRGWPWASPVLIVAGAAGLLVGVSPAIAGSLLVAGSAVLLLACVLVSLQVRLLFLRVMTLGALLLVVGNALVACGRAAFEAAPWWAGSIALTIAGERLERARLVERPRWADGLLAAMAGVAAVGLVAATAAGWTGGPEAASPGMRRFGLALAGLAGWLLAFDLARRTLRSPGLTGYMAAALLSGFGWLLVAGAAWMGKGMTTAGPWHDVVLHAFFVGFVLPMIFGHAPVVIPAMAGFPVAYGRVLWVPLALLHVSLAVRLAGDLTGSLALREWGGLLNALALASFPLALLAAAKAGPQTARPAR